MNKRPNLTLKAIGARWGVSPTTVRRTFFRHNVSGTKLGQARSASVRFTEQDVAEVERRAVAREVAVPLGGGIGRQPNLTLNEIGERWGVHRTTARRRLDEFGREAKKLGRARSASVRYTLEDVEEVERWSRRRP
jgi:Fic family protein